MHLPSKDTSNTSLHTASRTAVLTPIHQQKSNSTSPLPGIPEMRITITEEVGVCTVGYFEGEKLVKREFCSSEEAIRLLFKYPTAAMCDPLPGSSLYYLWRDVNAKSD